MPASSQSLPAWTACADLMVKVNNKQSNGAPRNHNHPPADVCPLLESCVCERKKGMGYRSSNNPLSVICIKNTSFPSLPVLWEHREKPWLSHTQDPGTRLFLWSILHDTVASCVFLPIIKLILNATGPGGNPSIIRSMSAVFSNLSGY